ncbi:MAG: trigger factor [Candidatus Dojkabacteria bacterium]|nr:MAG: trigger factor [Candidatus Dojkabacteria bacterium]
MAQLLEPGAQKLVGAKKIVSQEGSQYIYEITVNGAVQKDAYEKIFAAKSKEIQIKGFRKGEAPRNLVEQQIYQEVIKDLTNLLVNYSVEELLADEGIIATSSPEVESVTFTMVESPLVYRLKIDKLPDYTLVDTRNYTVKLEKSEVSTEDIETAKKNLWEEWVKKASEEDKKTYEALSDVWVKEQMKIPNVETVQALEGLLREELEHAKLHQEEDRLVNEALAKVIADMKIVTPQSVIDKNFESTRQSQEAQFKQYGITFADYLKHYNKTEEQNEKEIRDAAEKRFKEDVFWTLFIRDRKIKVDPQNPQDVVFINYAASSLRIKPDEKLSQRQIDVILQTAAMYKAVQLFKQEIGLQPHEEPEIAVGNTEAQPKGPSEEVPVAEAPSQESK